MAGSMHAHPQSSEDVETASQATPDPLEAEQLGTLLGLLADPTRLRATFALRSVEEICVGDLALALDISLDQASYALKQLRAAGLVRTRRDGRIINYSLAEQFPHQLLDHCLRHLSAISKEGD